MGLVWREQLSVGNDWIDLDHKHLIDIINQVEESLVAKSRAKLVAALDNLSQYSYIHFEREERIATAAGYVEIAHMKKSHQELIAQLEQVRGRFDSAGQQWSSEAAARFTDFLRGWLIDHVIKEDLLMKPVLQKLSPRFDGA